MKGVSVGFWRSLLSRRLKMSGVSREAPLGIQCLQLVNYYLFPRLRINRLKLYQCSVFILTYLTYTTYHLTRKPISVVKSVLHQNCSGLIPPPDISPSDDEWCNWAPFNTKEANTLLGTLDSAFLFMYAGAMFVFGMIAERADLRYFLTFGMLISSIFCYLFGLGRTLNIHNIYYYLLVQAGAGIAQTTGWPGTVAVLGKWFRNQRKGLIFGIWNSHTSLGNILGTLLAAAFVETDWALSFIYPALAMAVVSALVMLFLVPEPKHVGLAADVAGGAGGLVRRPSKGDDPAEVIVGDQPANLRPNRHSTNNSQSTEDEERTSLLDHSHQEEGQAISLRRAITIPGVLEFSMSLFFAKLVSYTFMFWLPVYISTSTATSAAGAGTLSTVFDVGGVAGAIVAGSLADATRAPALVCLGFYVVCGPALFAYDRWGSTSYATSLAMLLVAGALVNGPYALITTAVSAELGTQGSIAGNAKALATVTAIIDGTGSVGAAIGPMLAGAVSSHGSWDHVFYMLIICNYVALFLLLRIARSELVKLCHERRMSSPRLVRIE